MKLYVIMVSVVLDKVQTVLCHSQKETGGCACGSHFNTNLECPKMAYSSALQAVLSLLVGDYYYQSEYTAKERD